MVPAFVYPIIGAVIVIALISLLITTSYVKAPPDTAFIISGAGKKRILIGKAGLCIPLLNRMDKLLLRQVSVDIKTNGYIPTKDFIGVDIDAIAKVAVMSDNEMVKVADPNGSYTYPAGDAHEGEHYRLVPGIDLATKNFLNMNEAQIIKALTDSLQGNMREIIGTMELRVISSDRKAFGDQVQEKAQSDMNNLGIKIISCNIQKVIDENGLINALGQDNMSKIQKEAAIAKAEAERDVAIKQAETAREANDARVISNLEIAQKNNELAMRKSDLKKIEDTKMAEAEAMEKRAEAYKKYNSAAIVEMMIKIMPQMASEIAKPLSSIDSINIYGTGDGNSGATQISGNMPIVMKQVFDTMSQATGVDLSEIIRANTYDAKVTRNVNVTGMPGVQPAQTTAEEAKE